MDVAMMIKKTVDSISSNDLIQEGRAAIARGESVEFASYQLREGEQLVDVAHFPNGRAGVAWGGPAAWFDADSLDDALETWIKAQNGDEEAIAHIKAN